MRYLCSVWCTMNTLDVILNLYYVFIWYATSFITAIKLLRISTSPPSNKHFLLPQLSIVLWYYFDCNKNTASAIIEILIVPPDRLPWTRFRYYLMSYCYRYKWENLLHRTILDPAWILSITTCQNLLEWHYTVIFCPINFCKF